MNEKTRQILEENGIDKIHFYQARTPLLSNAFTACVLFNSEKCSIEARGVSICSLLDTFNISEGKNRAFGRAIKALKRKGNFFKINGSARSDQFVQRAMKIKNETDDENFMNEIVTELQTVSPPNMEIKVLSGKKFMKKYLFSVPLSYPVMIANRYFKYKSQFRPTPVGEEELSLVADALVEEAS